MRVALVLDEDIDAGGGFNQALCNARDITDRMPAGSEAVLFTRRRTAAKLADQGLRASLLPPRRIDRVLSVLHHRPRTRRGLRRLGLRSPFGQCMQANTIDLVVFCAPSALALCLEGTPFIYTVWDLNHQERLEFPEVGRLDERQVRDAIHGAAVRGAFAVLADSPELIAGLTRSFGVPPGRMVELPFSTPAYLSSGGEDGPAVARWYGLPERLIFYPAQFWPHKNHVRLLQALALLRARSADLHLVLAGSDKGNLKHVKAEAARLNVADRVRWLGFVPDDHMRGLYEACSVVAMPSYFGPTNIPPLEAWLMRRPLVYSSHLAAHTGSAALYADADDPNEWADQILRALDPEVASRLVAAGVEQLQRQQDRRAQGLAEVTDRLARLARRRETWPR